MAILVTGGAGYIGSHTVIELINQGEDVVVIDNLSTGHRASVQGAIFYEGDLLDSLFLDDVFQKHEIEAVIHFAAKSLVGESVEQPLIYYDNNVIGSHRLLSAMVKHGVKKIVFSSTANVYGDPMNIPIKEDEAINIPSPYGESKFAVEQMLRWCDKAYGLKSICLRYFNASGAHPDAIVGEDHRPETHLIPLMLQVVLGQRDNISIYGDDYPTKDGTCIRDYIHVMDLANAHWLAIQYLRQNDKSDIFNLGSGEGYSVKEIVEYARKITGHPIPSVVTGRRAGDPAVLIASSEKAKHILGWKPKYENLNTIIQTAWNWHQKNPKGYQEN